MGKLFTDRADGAAPKLLAGAGLGFIIVDSERACARTLSLSLWVGVGWSGTRRAGARAYTQREILDDDDIGRIDTGAGNGWGLLS